MVAIEQLIPAEKIKRQEPMSKHTSFRTGGEADMFIVVENGEQLSKLIPYLRQNEKPFFVLGFGSNLLVSDKGYPGVVLKLAGDFTEITVRENLLTVGAGVSMAKVAKVAYDHALTGFEFASGIPGSIGGGVAMNAGAYGGEMCQVIEWVDVMDENGSYKRLRTEEMEFGYRTSVVKTKGYYVLRAGICLKHGEQGEIRSYMEELSDKRREKQPLEYPSAGSTFKRPAGYFAGKLIMDAGLAGYRIGDAQVSEKHCGFIVNRGQATSSEIYRLICFVRDEVLQKFQVELEPEVIILGEF